MGEERGFRHYSQPQVQLTPQAQKQIALNELDRMIEERQKEIRELQHKVLTLQEVRGLVAAH